MSYRFLSSWLRVFHVKKDCQQVKEIIIRETQGQHKDKLHTLLEVAYNKRIH